AKRRSNSHAQCTLCGALNGVNHLECRESFPSADDRLRRAADDAAEVGDLQAEGVFRRKAQPLAFDRRPPAWLARMAPEIELRNRKRTLHAADLVTGLHRVAVGRVLAGGEFPA